MGNEIRKEPFIGKYDGVVPPVLLTKGGISDGKNIRKVSETGGWKGRKGCTLNNTTAAESSASVVTLHQYTNPKQSDYHFIAQCNSKLLDATNDPPAAGTTFGSDLGLTVGTSPGVSTVVGETWFYADGSGRPATWGGASPFPMGWFTYDTSNTALCDYTKEVTDGDTTTSGLILAASDDYFILITPERCEGVTLNLGDVNSNAETITVEAWRSGSWTGVSGTSDGTLDTGKTLAQDGAITWTRSTSDDLKIVGNMQGYAYKFTWSGALSGTVTVLEATVTMDADLMTSKWNGLWEWVTGCRFYDADLNNGEYQECLGKVTNESDAQYIDISEGATGDFIYIKTPEPATGFGFGVATGYTNTTAGNIDLIEIWDGDDWENISTVDDGTLNGAGTDSFSQTGRVTFDATSITARKRTFEGDDLPGYWYRVSWDLALSTDVRIYAVLYAPLPETLGKVNGVIEFKGRLMIWEEGENRLRYSAKNKPWAFSGSDSGWTDPFGGEDEVIMVEKFYNELVVFKGPGKGVYLLEGYSPATLGILQLSSTHGLASKKTVVSVEVGFPGMHTDEPVNILIWQEVDGVYVLDGRKPKKVSGPVAHYFDTEYATAIAANSIRSLQAFPDPLKNEYHLLIPSGELVFNYVTDEWYPPWDRAIDLNTGIALRGTDDRIYTYGASTAGLVMRLENDTSDKNTSNVDQIIQHGIKCRAFGALEEGGVTLEFTLRRIWAELKAEASGSVVTKTFKNRASSGTTQSSPAAISMVNTGYDMAVDFLTCSITGCFAMEVEVTTNTLDLSFEIWSMIFELEVQRLIGQ